MPVGPVVDGVRTATLDVPLPHRIRLADDDSLDGANVVLTPRDHPGVERWLMDIVDGTVPVRWGGRFDLTVRLEDGTPDRVVTLDLPPLPAGAVERRIDLERDARPVTGSGEARLNVRRADGQSVPELTVSGGKVGAAWSGFQGKWDNPVEVWAPCRVLLTAPGLHPLQLDVTRPGDQDVVFPAAGIDLTTVDASGASVASAVLVNGVLYEAPEGQLSMRGFPAGDHAVVVQRTSWPPTVSESVRWRLSPVRRAGPQEDDSAPMIRLGRQARTPVPWQQGAQPLVPRRTDHPAEPGQIQRRRHPGRGGTRVALFELGSTLGAKCEATAPSYDPGRAVQLILVHGVSP